MTPGADKMKDKYQHLDQSKVKDAGELGLNMKDVDPAGSAVLETGGSGRPFHVRGRQPTGVTGQNGDCATRRQGTTGKRARPAAPATGARATQPAWCVARFPAATRCVG
ncbi:hypothetical protein GA0070606_2352 [Micromonospora citrea]|uniref:Uncharacterized protein n=2 Tax=Micromonospora citrea TaxID=47855 RepID=A0A1C6ULG6_9ACTN|nr:hypothetical protein GA0070606_2352 [Micromonospora citrea]